MTIFTALRRMRSCVAPGNRVVIKSTAVIFYTEVLDRRGNALSLTSRPSLSFHLFCLPLQVRRCCSWSVG